MRDGFAYAQRCAELSRWEIPPIPGDRADPLMIQPVLPVGQFSLPLRVQKTVPLTFPLVRCTGLICLIILMILFPVSGCLCAEPTREQRIEENYHRLKSTIEADAERNSGVFFDEDIETVKREMGLGFNFGNSLDWSFNNEKVRRYKIRITLGFEDDVFFAYEAYVNPLGYLRNFENHPISTQEYADFELLAANQFLLSPMAKINNLKICLSNAYSEAALQPVDLLINFIQLIDKNGEDLLQDPSILKSYPTAVSAEWVQVISIPLDTTVGAFAENVVHLLADIRLDHFISDYKNHPELVYQDTYNGEPATDAELAFLKEQGFSSIRLPVTWFGHMNSEGTVDPEWFDEVNRIVDRILGYGFYVIINIHHDGGKEGWIKADPADFQLNEYLYRYLVLQIAENFKHYGSKLILGGSNEVTNYQKEWKIIPETSKAEIDTLSRINQIFVDEVRFTGYNNTNRFLITSPWYGYFRNLEYYLKPEDSAENKILTEIHDFLQPGEECLKSVLYLKDKKEQYLSTFSIILSEAGVLRGTEQELKNSVLKKYISMAYQMGIPVFYWDDGGNYALMKNGYEEWDSAYQSDLAAEVMIAAYEKGK